MPTRIEHISKRLQLMAGACVFGGKLDRLSDDEIRSRALATYLGLFEPEVFDAFAIALEDALAREDDA